MRVGNKLSVTIKSFAKFCVRHEHQERIYVEGSSLQTEAFHPEWRDSRRVFTCQSALQIHPILFQEFQLPLPPHIQGQTLAGPGFVLQKAKVEFQHGLAKLHGPQWPAPLPWSGVGNTGVFLGDPPHSPSAQGPMLAPVRLAILDLLKTRLPKS